MTGMVRSQGVPAPGKRAHQPILKSVIVYRAELAACQAKAKAADSMVARAVKIFLGRTFRKELLGRLAGLPGGSALEPITRIYSTDKQH
jgi:hypothetical protein